MRTLKITQELRAESENEAQEYIAKVKEEATDYTVGAAGYTYKVKKAKGEVIDEAWITKITKIYSEVWD